MATGRAGAGRQPQNLVRLGGSPDLAKRADRMQRGIVRRDVTRLAVAVGP